MDDEGDIAGGNLGHSVGGGNDQSWCGVIRPYVSMPDALDFDVEAVMPDELGTSIGSGKGG